MLDISDYGKSSHFKDYGHKNEAGFAVLEAVNNGTLDCKVYESYMKLHREAWHFSTSEHERRMRDKTFSKYVKQVKTNKPDSKNQ